jgi:hypothetical protein
MSGTGNGCLSEQETAIKSKVHQKHAQKACPNMAGITGNTQFAPEMTIDSPKASPY